jgi:hypothetical protein
LQFINDVMSPTSGEGVNVAPVRADEQIVSESTDKAIGAISGEHAIVAHSAVQLIIAALTGHNVRTVAGRDRAAADRRDQQVVC